jgi:hypothetical protein
VHVGHASKDVSVRNAYKLVVMVGLGGIVSKNVSVQNAFTDVFEMNTHEGVPVRNACNY